MISCKEMPFVFDIEEYVNEIKVEKEAEGCYEKGVPATLKEALEKYKKALLMISNKEPYLHIDCDFCELQSEINNAEVNQQISERQAEYLRRVYLYDEE